VRKPFGVRRALSVGLILVAITPAANSAVQDLAAVGPADPAPPDYCKQDPDWYLCRHGDEPSRTPPPTAASAPPSQARAAIRGPDRATTIGSLPR
jgi:hypothetical protein